MKIGKQINKGYKCLQCGKYGLEPYTIQQQQVEGWRVSEVIGFRSIPYCDWIYRCRNCLAEYEALPKEMKKNGR